MRGRTITLSATLALLSVYLACPILAAEGPCPKPVHLNCSDLDRLYVQKKCEPPMVQVVQATPPIGPPGPQGPPGAKGDKGDPGVTSLELVPMPAEAPRPTGKMFAALGPIYNAGWGGQGVIGYHWANGWMLMGGPNWIDHAGKSGTVSGSMVEDFAKHHGGGDVDTFNAAYTAPAPSPWGGMVLLGHAW